VPERRAEKSHGLCTMDGVNDTGAIGPGFANVVDLVLGNPTDMFGLGLKSGPGIGSGLGKTGAGSTDSLGTGATTVLTCVVGASLVSATPGSGSTIAVLMGMEAAGMRSLGAPVAGVRAQGATSSFGGVTVGLSGAQTGCEGVVGRKSLELGTGPIDWSVSVAQLNRLLQVSSVLSSGSFSRLMPALSSACSPSSSVISSFRSTGLRSIVLSCSMVVFVTVATVVAAAGAIVVVSTTFGLTG
jgi:hypothetical protein